MQVKIKLSFRESFRLFSFFFNNDRMRLIISLSNFDLWALVFQSTRSIRPEPSLKCVRQQMKDRLVSKGRNGNANYVHFTIRLFNTQMVAIVSS